MPDELVKKTDIADKDKDAETQVTKTHTNPDGTEIQEPVEEDQSDTRDKDS